VPNIFGINESTSALVFLHREYAGEYTLFTFFYWTIAPCISHTSPPSTSDFPGGEGETRFLNRGGLEHIQGETGLRALGFKKFDVPEGASMGETQAVFEANRILFSEV
jgi:hypothetical protein